MRQFVAKKADSAGFSEKDVEQIKIAVDEACTNVIKHAYNGEGEHVIDIAVILSSDKLTVRIRDRGRAFNPETYAEPDLIEFAKSRKSGGLGVHIMNRLMDRVEYKTKVEKIAPIIVNNMPPNAPPTRADIKCTRVFGMNI